MNKAIKALLVIVAIAGFAGILVVLTNGNNLPVLNPQGSIADQERSLIIFTSLLALVIVIPVFTMLFVIAWKYREGNKKATYSPDWDHSRLYETIWWGVPCIIILILGVVTWKATHDLDPYKALDSKVKPINVQVIALQWKWLFIYPEQGIASVNLVQFPEDTPVNFQITADAPMNSFWIPSLGGQVYAMNGMSTKLHLIADHIGDYKGSSANISGEGFAGMNFIAKATSRTDFDTWVKSTKNANELDEVAYEALAKPTKNVKPSFYTVKKTDLYNSIIAKYMGPDGHGHHKETE